MTEHKIRLLDADTANKIAAGEVVERPASVVKELAENSLDAGAKIVAVEISGGGVDYIRVTDDGEGMTEEDAGLSVLRHATSKLRTEADLSFIKTMGFRGEALPSIASVSRLSLLTRRAQADLAVQLTVVGGQTKDLLLTGGAVGTTVTVRDLFFNVPARRKFLRTENTEGRQVADTLGRLALIRPDVKFSLDNNGRRTLSTPGGGRIEDAIAAVYGAQLRGELLPASYDRGGLAVAGFIGKPSVVKASRQWQTLAVNGRVINSRFITRALDHAYQAKLPKNGYPFAVLLLTVNTEELDVNIHPQKSEVKFSDEQAVYRAVLYAVSEALTQPLKNVAAAPAAAPAPEETAPAASVFSPRVLPERPAAHYEPSVWKRPPCTVREEVTVYGKKDVEGFTAAREALSRQAVLTAFPNEEPSGTDDAKSVWPLGQIDKLYIVAQSEQSLYIIDQHAAHERIIFDRLSAGRKDVPAQEFLIPFYVELPPDEVDLALAHRETFVELGFDLEAAGPATLRLLAAPADLSSEELPSFVREALRSLLEMKKPAPADLRKELIALASCRAAVKAGQTLNMREMRELLNQLMKTDNPFTCPHGRPVIVKYDAKDLAGLFKRT